MNLRRTFHATWTSYLSMAATIAVSLLMIRKATIFLSPEEFGLWSFTLQTLGYFLLLDFGVSGALGRMFGEPLASGKQSIANAWYTLSFIILGVQAAIITAAGFALKDPVIAWFGIPSHLRDQASLLWTVMLCIQAISLVLRANSAVLFAQNRVYLANITPVTGLILGYIVFVITLNQGAGVMAYAWSSGVSVCSSSLITYFCVSRGPHKFSFELTSVSRSMIKELFSYSISIFVIGLAVQIVFISQGLIVTKLLGIAAGAVYAVTSRIPMMTMQLVWKPFDSFAPRWQQQFCESSLPRVQREFPLLARVSILLSTVGFVGIVMVNPLFVILWTKPEYYGGAMLDLLLGFYIIVQTYTHCFSYAFNLHKKMRSWTIFELVLLPLSLGFMYFGVRSIGLAGIPAGLLAAGFLGGGFWYVVKRGGDLLGVSFSKVFLADALLVTALVVLTVYLGMSRPWSAIESPFLQVSIVLAGSAALAAPAVFRICSLLRQLRP